MRFVGIDVGVAAMHCVVLDGSCHMSAAQALPSDAATELKALTHDATAIAIDAPFSLTGRPTAGLTCVLERKASAGLARGRERAVTSCGLVERCEPDGEPVSKRSECRRSLAPPRDHP